MFAVKAKIYGVLYNQASSVAFDETSSYWSVYFEQLSRQTRHSHPLAFRQIHTTANYYKYSFFPLSIAYWNRLPAEVVMLPTLDQFSVAVRSLDHRLP